MTARPKAPAAERNRQPIMDVLADELNGRERVLEIGSGTGQHAVFFARNMPGLFWQTSDLPQNHAGIIEWIKHAGCSNVGAPLDLDVESPQTGDSRYDAVFSANTAHIMNERAVECMFRIAGEVLRPGGAFFLYGPFRIDGRFTSESNKEFDRSLRARDASMGIRELGVLDGYGRQADLQRVRIYGMPANNLIVVWRKGGEPALGEC